MPRPLIDSLVKARRLVPIRGGLVAPGGGLAGHGDGGGPQAFDAIREGGGPALMSAMGLGGLTAPNALWLFETSITVASDLSGNGFNLTNDGTTLAAVNDAQMGGTVIEWDNGAGDRMAAATNGVLDVTNGSVAILQVTRITSGNPAGTRGLCGKNSGTDGYELQLLATGALRFDARDGGVSETRASTLTSYADGSPIVVLAGVDRTRASELYLATNREARVEANLTLASLTVAVPFWIGATANVNSAGKHTRLVAVWLGAAAEQLSGGNPAFNQTACSTLKSFLSI